MGVTICFESKPSTKFVGNMCLYFVIVYWQLQITVKSIEQYSPFTCHPGPVTAYQKILTCYSQWERKITKQYITVMLTHTSLCHNDVTKWITSDKPSYVIRRMLDKHFKPKKSCNMTVHNRHGASRTVKGPFGNPVYSCRTNVHVHNSSPETIATP